VSCVHNVASFSGLFILDCHFGISNVYLVRRLTVCFLHKNNDHHRIINTIVIQLVMFCRSLFVLLYFLLAIVLSVLLRYTNSDYSFGIFKLFLWFPSPRQWLLRYSWYIVLY